jgi:large subunit ribosomal protein L4
MSVTTFTKTGTKAATAAKLDKNVFGIEVKNHELLKAAYVAYLSNGRGNLAVAKTRGLVSGGGRKPWKQKGTGRARFGSSRNPIWRGGGIVFGPTGEENYKKSLNATSKKLAMKQALTLANAASKVAVIDAFAVSSAKTSDAAKLLQKIGAQKNTIIVVEDVNNKLVRATRNIADVKLVQPAYLNVFDVLNANLIVFETAALKQISERLGATK